MRLKSLTQSAGCRELNRALAQLDALGQQLIRITPGITNQPVAAPRLASRNIWESQEAFEAFGVTLLPLLTAASIEMNEPMVVRVHNEIKG
jgi:hypothetical protein